MTWNIHSAVSPRFARDLDSVAAAIAASGADVVALQESDRHWGPRSHLRDQPAWLAEQLGWDWAFCAHIERPPRGGGEDHPRQFGVAVLSRFALHRVETHHLRSVARRTIPVHLPSLLEVSLQVGPTPVVALATHFDVFSDAQRVREAREIAEVVGSLEGPLVLMGDLNSGPGSRPMRVLRQAGLRDVGAAAASPLRTFPSTAPVLRLDHILVRRLAIASAWVGASRASDHRPLLADLEVPT